MENGIKYIPESRDAVVWGIVEDKFNRLLTTHYNAVVPIKIHEGAKTSDFKGYQEMLSKQMGKPFSNLHYFSPIKDQYQNLWLPSADGLIRYDYTQFELVFNNNYAFFVAEDVKRNLIISSVGGGVNIVENKTPYKVTELREKDGLHSNTQMLCVFVDSKGRHWYGGGRGLTRYDYEHKKAFRYPMKSEKVPFYSVYMITEDPYGTLWFGTSKGLYYYSEKTDSFTVVAQNILKGPVDLVGILDKNHLIYADRKSLFVLNLTDFYKDKSENVKVFNYNNGFMGLEPSQAGICKTHDGKVWIASSDVMSILSPNELDLSIKATPTMFTKIDTQAVSFIKSSKELVYQLPHGKSDNVRIEFTSLGFEKSVKPSYSYQLDNKDWSEWQEEPFVILYNLTSDEHTLKVKTQISGIQKELKALPASIKFRSSLYPWQSPNFAWYLLPIVLLVLSFALFKWFWERRLRQKMETQQQELKFLKIAALQAQMNPHFIFNILEVIKSYILLNQPRVAANMVTKLGELVRNYLESTILDIENKRKSIFSTEITLRKEIELLTLFVEFEHIKAHNRFDYRFEIDEDLDLNSMSIPPMLIQPIVENAIKNGLLNLPDDEFGHLNISIHYRANILCFVVMDTGVGKAKAEEIKKSAVRQHISRAESLVKQRQDILNDVGYKISIVAENISPHGTKVTVCFDFN